MCAKMPKYAKEPSVLTTRANGSTVRKGHPCKTVIRIKVYTNSKVTPIQECQACICENLITIMKVLRLIDVQINT